MERQVFAERFKEAAEDTVAFARTMLVETLKEELLFAVELNASLDNDPLEPDELVFPKDTLAYPKESLQRLTMTQVITLLWREGAVPEWIDLSVEDVGEKNTIVAVRSCGRFTSNESLLYHRQKGLPPFHVCSPPLPPEHAFGSRERFSIHWLRERKLMMLR